MTDERQPIKCGELELVWNGNGYSADRFHVWTETKCWRWTIVRSMASLDVTVRGRFNRPQQAADDLAKFLGELHRATEGFS